jgi:diguanylate cyclase (GGDEF)-like protein
MALAAAPNLQHLQFDISAQSLLAKSDPSWQDYQESLQDFGSDAVVMLVMSDPELFSPDKLEQIRATLRRLEALEFVKDSSSLFDVPNVQEVDGYIESKPFLHEFPQNDTERDQLIDDALANTLVRDNLISDDRQTMAINLFIDATRSYPGRDSDITAAIEKEVAPLKRDLQRVYQMSGPYVRDQISRQIEHDIRSILPSALAVLILVLGASMGRFNCSVVPMSSAIISIVLTLALMAWLGIAINVLTSIVPALLIIIGSTEDVHLMAEYHLGLRQGENRKGAVRRLPLNQSTAITLAFVTTFIGFLSITVNDLELLTEFGLVVSAGLLINFLVTILFVPAYLSLFGGKPVMSLRKFNRFQGVALAVFNVVIRFKKLTLVVLLAGTGYLAWHAQHLQVNNNTLDYFDEKSEVRQRAAQIHDDLSGMQSFSIIMDSSIEGTFQKVRYLEEVEQVQAYLASMGIFDKSFSFADFIKLTHKVMEGVDQPQLPLDDDVVQVYMEFVQFDAVAGYVTQDYSSTRILVRHNIGSSAQLERAFDAIEHFIEHDLQTSLKVTLTGDSVLSNRAADALAWGQIQSLALMIVVILLLVSLLFIDFRAGLIGLAPNLFPVIALFGVMGYFRIPLDSGTVMVAAVALGISVDDTIHFLTRYHHLTRNDADVENALEQTIIHEATPISTTSIALALGFSALMLSSFQPVVYFGALSALVMVLAMFSTFVLTPVLLSFIRLTSVWDMLSLNIKDDVLRHSPIFRGLKPWQIKQTILSGAVREFQRGDVIVDQGVLGGEFFVMLEGSATATHKDPDGSIHTLGYLRAGDLFGEVAELSQRERMARVTAQERVRALELKWNNIRQLGRFNPRISMRLYRNLSEVMSKRIVERTEQREKPRDELTGALTKPFLCEFLKQELKRSKARRTPVSLVLLRFNISSIDDSSFETIHDSIVYSVSRLIYAQLRDADIFARWDECGFMLMLPETDADGALQRVNALRQEIQSNELIEHRIRIDVDAVLAQAKPGERSQELIERLEISLQDLIEQSKRVNVAVA